MKKTKLGTNTNLIRGGLNRSQFNETSEALFLTSGFNSIVLLYLVSTCYILNKY